MQMMTLGRRPHEGGAMPTAAPAQAPIDACSCSAACAADLPGAADVDLRDARAALLAPAQPVQRDAPDLDQGLIAIGMTFVILTAGIDLSVGSLLGARRPGGGRGRQGRPQRPFRCRRHRRRRAMAGSCAAGGDRRRARWRLRPGARDHPPEGAAVRGDAGRPVRLPRRGADVRRRRPDQRLRAPTTAGGARARSGRCRCRSSSSSPSPSSPTSCCATRAIGRQVYAVGGNPEAARLSGLNVGRITLSVYVIIGFFAGLAGFVLSARLNSSEAVAGIGYELTVIAAVVIGGTSLFGGVGSDLRHGDRLDPDRRADQRPRADERVPLHPADHHRRDHRARRGLRPVRKIAPGDLSRSSKLFDRRVSPASPWTGR